jgi:haloalkane dehalogenase
MREDLKFDVDRALFPFESKFVDSRGGARIHYVDEGQGPVVLMLHGNPTWSFLYRKMIARMSAHFRCVAVDYPGFGLSTAPDGYDFLPSTHANVVSEFVEALDLADFIVVMQDWGGPIGLAVAERHPKRVRGLVIGNTWGWPLAGELRMEAFSWLMGGPIGRTMARTFNGVWRYFMKEGFVEQPSEPEMAMYRAPFLDRANRIQTAIFPRQLVKAQAFEAEVEAGLNKLSSKEVLFLWGTEDFAFRKPELERFMTYFPNHEHHALHASHFWQDDQGEVAADHILDWAKRQGWIG